VSWRFASPYVFVGGKAEAVVRLAAGASAEWRYATDRKQWKTVARLAKAGSGTLAATLDEVVSPRRQPTYEFWLQLVLKGGAAAEGVSFESDVQTALLCLPELEVGTNRIVYTDSQLNDRQVRLTHEWCERTAWHPPRPPAEAITPKQGQVVAGSKVEFRWSPATDPDGEEIVDYHFELSEYEDMRWPLSPNFEKVISRTPFKGKARWSVPYVGLLNPQTPYYWRVRARDASGVWGPWSPTFRFEVKAPGVPLDLRLVRNGADGFTLKWRPNPQGRPPVAYKVYGSDERGFTASDTPQKVFRGKGFVKTIEEFEKKPDDAPDAGLVATPSNLISRVEESSLNVVGADLQRANTNKAYYRVAAVDSEGNESGPSDYVEVPRPHVFTRPQQKAQLGKPYSYQPGLIRSIGHLTCRRSPKSSYNAAFWDREEHAFTPVRLPEGLSLDAVTGAIRGKPTKAGTFDVVFKVSNQSGRKTQVAYRLTVTE